MASDPIWLTVGDIVAIHDGQLARFGGAIGIKSIALLESAVSAPINLLHYGQERDVLRLGSHLAHALVRNHPFVDGNQRSATVALLEFLYLNGWWIDLPDSEQR